MNAEFQVQEMQSDQFNRLVAARSNFFAVNDMTAKTFDPLKHIEMFEARFPDEMNLHRQVGIHALDKSEVFNPYTKQFTPERFNNVGEHCMAAGYCALKIAEAMRDSGVIDEQAVQWIVGRALIHDINKPFETMRRDAAKSGIVPEDIYSIAAYEMVKPFLLTAGIPEKTAQYVARAGSETGHNSFKDFIVPGEQGIERLVADKMLEKIVHLADDMTFTNNPEKGKRARTVFLTCRDRMFSAGFIEKYPFLWTEGLAKGSDGAIIPVRNIENLAEGQTLIGHYAALQVQIARRICIELQVLIDPSSRVDPEDFIKKIVNS